MIINIAKKAKDGEGKRTGRLTFYPVYWGCSVSTWQTASTEVARLSLRPFFSFLKIHFCNHLMMYMQGGYVKVFSEARGIESPGAGFTDGWELPDVGAGNPIRVFHKNSVCSS